MPGFSIETNDDPVIGAATVARAEFLLRLRARGIHSIDLLRALEMVPRHMFVPHRYADLATRDVALPIPCGQTMPEPFVLARMVEALALEPLHRVLEIGTGSGYMTAVLARLAGEVLSLERFQSLSIEARTRLETLDVINAAVVWGDGLALPSDIRRFDRILVEALVEKIPPNWFDTLSTGGVMVMARAAPPGALPRQCLMRVTRDRAGQISETPIVGSRLRPLLPGLSQGL